MYLILNNIIVMYLILNSIYLNKNNIIESNVVLNIVYNIFMNKIMS